MIDLKDYDVVDGIATPKRKKSATAPRKAEVKTREIGKEQLNSAAVETEESDNEDN